MSHHPYVWVERPPEAGFLLVTGEEARHLATVLRARPGTEFVAFDGSGAGWRAVVESVETGRVQAKVIGGVAEKKAKTSVTLLIGAIKAPRMDWLVEKATELGAARLVAMVTQRSVVTPGLGRMERWRNLAVAAAKQSRRLRLPELSPPVEMRSVVSAYPSGVPLWVLDFSDRARLLGEIAPPEPPPELTVAVGPEGGFTSEELDGLADKGARFWSLGLRPLRSETAAVAALAALAAKGWL